jgi:hypothetical protein
MCLVARVCRDRCCPSGIGARETGIEPTKTHAPMANSAPQCRSVRSKAAVSRAQRLIELLTQTQPVAEDNSAGRIHPMLVLGIECHCEHTADQDHQRHEHLTASTLRFVIRACQATAMLVSSSPPMAPTQIPTERVIRDNDPAVSFERSTGVALRSVCVESLNWAPLFVHDNQLDRVSWNIEPLESFQSV